MKSFSFILSIFLSLCFLQSVSGQHLSKEQVQQIDSLFTEYHESPPVAYGILYNDDVVSKHFGGKAYQEMEQPMQFRLGGMAQHFTAYGLLLLEEKELIQLEEEISTYLGTQEGLDLSGVTVNNLLNHTHGLPEYWTLKSLLGYDEYDRFTALEVKNMFDKKWNKVHTPEQKVSFSGTGVYLMTRIIEKVTEQGFAQFMEESVFAPMKMKHTYFNDPTSGKILNILSYEQKDKIFEPQIVRHYDNGPAGLITTMDDLLIWFQHLADKSKAINRKMDEVMHIDKNRVAEIPNGKITYGQQFMHMERGINKIWDYGHIGGFAASVFRFPSQNLCIISLTKNGLFYNGFLGMQISDIILKDKYQPESEAGLKTIPLNDEIAEKFTGVYLHPDDYDYRHIILRDDTLRFYRPLSESQYALLPISKEELVLQTRRGNYTFRVADNTLQMRVENVDLGYDKVPPPPKANSANKQLIGTYLCEDLGLLLSIKEGEKGELVLAHNNDAFKLTLIAENKFASNSNHYKLLEAQLGAKKEVIGIKVSSVGFKDLVFRKLK